MTTFSGAPRLVKGGIALLEPQTLRVLRVIVLQYSPDTLSRTLQVQSSGGEGGERSESLRLKAPPVETISLEAAIDAADQLEQPAANPAAVLLGVAPQLALLETIVYPASAHLEASRQLAAAGAVEIVPPEEPLALFIWGLQRVLPVRLTEFSVSEEAFDPRLNPIRATVRLGMRVLSVSDLGFSHKGSSLFMAYLRAKETMRPAVAPAGLSVLNLGRML
jgi:hypothetical protein